MSANDNTQGLHIGGGGASPTGAANRNNEKPKTRTRSKQVSKIMEKNEDTNEAPQAPPPSHSSRKTAERKKKKDTPRKASTSTRKRRKTSSEKSEGCASSSRVAEYTAPSNFVQTEVTALRENKIKENPKPKPKFNKKKVNKNSKDKQGEATPTNQPPQFIGLYVCKEHAGVKYLGIVNSYDPQTKLFEIGYDDYTTGYMEHNEVLKSKATTQDIFEVQQALRQSGSLMKIADEEMQKATLGEKE